MDDKREKKKTMTTCGILLQGTSSQNESVDDQLISKISIYLSIYLVSILLFVSSWHLYIKTEQTFIFLRKIINLSAKLFDKVLPFLSV